MVRAAAAARSERAVTTHSIQLPDVAGVAPGGAGLPPGVGLGLRAAFAEALLAREQPIAARFLEIAPENYLGSGGARRRVLHAARERYAISVHGLCADLAGAAPLDEPYVAALRNLLDEVRAPFFSDHLCFTHLGGAELHDLVPLPHAEAAAARAAARIRALADRLERPIAIENVSALIRTPGGTMDEATFVRAVLEQADCLLLLDVNNAWVNAQNFGGDPRAFIDALPLERVVELHVAGAEYDADAQGFIDTHGVDVPDEVLALLAYVTERLGRPVPVLLERDHNIPALPELERELARVSAVLPEGSAAALLSRRAA